MNNFNRKYQKYFRLHKLDILFAAISQKHSNSTDCLFESVLREFDGAVRRCCPARHVAILPTYRFRSYGAEINVRATIAYRIVNDDTARPHHRRGRRYARCGWSIVLTGAWRRKSRRDAGAFHVSASTAANSEEQAVGAAIKEFGQG